MITRLALAAKALAALVVLAALTVGIPAGLAAGVGWPLPRTIPNLTDIADAVRYEGVAPGTVVKTLAVVAWVAWAQIAWAVAAEAAAACRGRLARRQPVLGSIQRNIARLVAVITIAAATLTAPRPAAVPAAAPALHTILPAPEDPTWIGISHTTQTSLAEPTTPREGVHWRVERHDTYWRIAETTLGDGHAWQRIRDLNIGRTMPDGTTITAASDLLRPGWDLLLPADATTPTPTSTERAAAGEATAVVVPGDSLWSIAEHRAAQALGRPADQREVTAYWAELISLNNDTIAEPDLIHPGQAVTLPAHQPPPPAAPPTPNVPPVDDTPPPPVPEASETPPPAPTSGPSAPAAPDTAAASAPAASADAASSPDTIEEPEAPAPAPGVLGVAATSLAAGAVVAYRRRRKITASRLPAGLDLPAPVGFDDLRAELAVAADLDQIDRIEAAVIDIARGGAAIAALTAGADRLVVHHNSGRHEPPLGWTHGPERATWLADPATLIPASGDASPAPLLVAVGRNDDGDIYVNLEAAGVTAIVGDHQHDVDALVRAIAAEITHAPGRRASLITVGAVGDLVAGDGPRRAFSWDDVADDIVALAHQSAHAIEATGAPTAFVARAEAGHVDGLDATLVILPAVPDDPRYADLVDLITQGSCAVAVLIAGPAAPATVLRVSDETLTIPSLGLTATAQHVSADTADRLEDLLAAAEETPTDLPMLDFGDPHDPAAADAEADIIVRVLGQVRVDGAFKALTPKQRAVVAYIALHQPVTGDRLEDAVWSTATSSRRKRLANTLSECRAALGANALPVAAGGLYRTGPGVTTDTTLFDAHVRAANDATTNETRRAELRAALELVEGPVFTTRNAERASYVWVDLENWVATWELKIATVALRLIEAATEDGDLGEAVWAAEQGLQALPIHVELTEALMRTYAARGDLAAAGTVYTSHVAALEDLDLDEVAPSTQDLWERLRPRQSA